MSSQAYFDNIQSHIIKRLHVAEHSIRVVVAWFTDPVLFDILLSKQKLGVRVEVLMANHRFNHESRLDFEALIQGGGLVQFVGDGDEGSPLMHNKFCIVDEKVLLFGSYNWTRKAQSNHESITIIDDDSALVVDFLQEFASLKAQQAGEGTVQADWGKIVIRLETLLNVIRLEDEEDIEYQVLKTKALLPKEQLPDSLMEVSMLLEAVEKGHYAEAVRKIQAFLNRMKQLVLQSDVEVSALQLEIKALEWQIATLEDEFTELEKLVYQFSVKHSIELGELILMILILKRQIAEAEKDQKAAQEAEKDYSQYKQAHDSNKTKVVNPLRPDEAVFIKDIYRKASKLCHPDKVGADPEQKKVAHQVFIELKDAYEANDLDKVAKIYRDLQQGIYQFGGMVLSQKSKLLQRRTVLLDKREAIEIGIQTLKESEEYQKVVQVGDWDNYFADIKQQLLQQKKECEQKLAGLSAV
jgi:hypothetical protein